MKPLVSVVVPAYNEEKRLPDCLRSLQQQTISQSFEVIVVNNCSTDQTPVIAQKFGTCVVYEGRKGVIFAKQKGLLSARGDIVAFLDADSIAPNHWLESILVWLKTPGIVAVTGPFIIADGPEFHQKYARTIFRLITFFYQHFGLLLYVAGSNLAFRRSIALKFGGLDTRKNIAEDEVGLAKKLKKHGRIVYDPSLIISTSGRRANGGVVNFIGQILFRYSLNYLTSQIIGKSIFPPYTDFR